MSKDAELLRVLLLHPFRHTVVFEGLPNVLRLYAAEVTPRKLVEGGQSKVRRLGFGKLDRWNQEAGTQRQLSLTPRNGGGGWPLLS